MAVISSVVTVTSSGAIAVVNGNDLDGASALVKNTTATETVYLGGRGVTDADGFPWAADDPPVSIDLKPGEILFARSDGDDQDLAVLATSEEA